VVENVDIVDQIRQGDLIEKIRVHEDAEKLQS
jgi:hypothetical protein